MGLAASQARLLMLTAQKDDLEGSILREAQEKQNLDTQAGQIGIEIEQIQDLLNNGGNINPVYQKGAKAQNQSGVMNQIKRAFLERLLRALQAKQNRIQDKEKEIDMKMAEDNTQLQAATTQISGIQQQISKDIQSEFKLFA